jgi:L-iditol 2-dehydrogenase
LLILQLARLAGVNKILATDILPHRVAAARVHGADETYLVAGDFSGRETALLSGKGLDVVFEAAGENSAVEMAVSAVRPGGKVMLVGIPPDDRTSFTASVARRKGLSIKLVRRMKLTYPRYQLVESGKVNVSLLVTHTFLSNMRLRLLLLPHGGNGLKVIITRNRRHDLSSKIFYRCGFRH